MKQLRRDIVAPLDVLALKPDAYQNRTYLTAALGAGFDVVDLAQAHVVSKKTIWALNEYDIDHEQPPKWPIVGQPICWGLRACSDARDKPWKVGLGHWTVSKAWEQPRPIE